jgi:uncharacterized protein
LPAKEYQPINRVEIIDRLIESREELQSHGVKSLAIFGSIARGDDTPGSDVDVLVELSRPMGLFGLSDLRQRLKEILEVDELDLITRDGIHPAIKDVILSEAIDVI